MKQKNNFLWLCLIPYVLLILDLKAKAIMYVSLQQIYSQWWLIFKKIGSWRKLEIIIG